MKTNFENKIENMRKAGQILIEFFDEIEKMIKPKISTKELDEFALKFITERGAKPSFLHYRGFPGSICTSIDSVVVHGIPNANELLEEGQIISIDIGACFKGFHADAARTYPVGKISEEKNKLIEVTKQSFFEGIKNIKAGSRIGDIGANVQRYVEKNGFSCVRDLVGHGVGKNLHEDPNIPNYGTFGTGMRLSNGQTIAIEPMVNVGTYEVKFQGPWDCKTKDGKPSAHYENTVLIKEDGIEILTHKSGEKNV